MRLAVSAGEILKGVESAHMKKKVPLLAPGDTVRVHVRVLEGQKERLQVFEGLVMGTKGKGTREMLCVRKISFGVGVERIFPMHSPFVSRIELVRKSRTRRAKLYYLRQRAGKASRLKMQFQEAAEGAVAEASPKTEEPPKPEAETKAEAGKPEKAKAKK